MAINEMTEKAKHLVDIREATLKILTAYKSRGCGTEINYHGNVCIEELYLSRADYILLAEQNKKDDYRRYNLTKKGEELAEKLEKEAFPASKDK